ncbi:hypothetical protein KAR34_02255 [bacterium]|nr:hypothetical protein [bacterium]
MTITMINTTQEPALKDDTFKNGEGIQIKNMNKVFRRIAEYKITLFVLFKKTRKGMHKINKVEEKDIIAFAKD